MWWECVFFYQEITQKHFHVLRETQQWNPKMTGKMYLFTDLTCADTPTLLQMYVIGAQQVRRPSKTIFQHIFQHSCQFYLWLLWHFDLYFHWFFSSGSTCRSQLLYLFFYFVLCLVAFIHLSFLFSVCISCTYIIFAILSLHILKINLFVPAVCYKKFYVLLLTINWQYLL